MNAYNYKNWNNEASFKDADMKQGIVTGYFASFGNKDLDGDVILKGAFARTINATGPDSAQPRIKHLQNHDSSKPLGKLTVLKEDEIGLYYESKIGTHGLGQDFIKMVESGLITEHSIGFKTIKQDKKSDANYMSELQLWEGSSLTAWGANHKTPVTGMKSMAATDIADRIKALEKFCRNTTATDETIELLLIEIKQLHQLIMDISTDPAKEATLPDQSIKVVRDWSELKTLLN